MRPSALIWTILVTLLFVRVDGKGEEVTEVYGVVSGSAHLPCNITSPSPGDGVIKLFKALL